ncbi:hypothetical protein H1D32_01425 [Anaerobacillus sp. CMMVII]|uniref:hypothetical protein n=1 Tax=Anaerobacillus sp. CMMVII TaxID=2755588 RepID=UPI0021B84858|nr:hypothetical protein [Anaerobacillus sp. CMMVII]MCT8136542.1 hypothetical protein [Anaerobacillus sp. CMMVII]
MKRSSNWDEKSIENQLRQLPKFEDSRSKEEIFERIQERLQEDQIKVRKKKKSWFVPIAAAAAVIFLMILIVPSFLNERNVSIEEPNAEFRMETTQKVADEEAEAGISSINDFPGITADEKSTDLLYVGAMQPYEAEQMVDEIITLGATIYTDNREFVVPVTLLAEGGSIIDRFLSVKDTFTGDLWGIYGFPQLQFNWIQEGEANKVNIDLPKNSMTNLTSAEQFIYSWGLIETFRPWYEEIQFSSDGEPGIDWGQTGHIPGKLLREPNRGYYLVETDTGHLFLVRGRVVNAPGNYPVGTASLEETLQFMKQDDEYGGYRAPIGEEFVITNVTEQKEAVTISFAEGTVLENQPHHLAMVEAILFAVGDFGYSYVQFEGLEPTQVGPYYTGDLLEIPRFANFIR